MTNRPRIGITMRLEVPTRRFYLGRDYSEAVQRLGAVPLHLGLIPSADYIENAVAAVDGIMLPGSNTDVDPALYVEEPAHRLGTVIPEKDETDQLVLEAAERLGKPVLAICYGMQALNVHRGGTLVQDIESEIAGSIKHEQGDPFTRPSHSIRLHEDSILGRLPVASERTDHRVNSSHHQAVKEIGRDLRATAWAADGVIEAIEDTRPGRFVVGVQWHPELMAGHDRLSSELFACFVDRCSHSMGSAAARGDIQKA